MGIDLWKTKYEFMYGHVDNQEYEFIDHFIPKSEDGTYYINKSILNSAVLKARRKETKVPDGLVKALKNAIKSESDITFSIF